MLLSVPALLFRRQRERGKIQTKRNKLQMVTQRNGMAQKRRRSILFSSLCHFRLSLFYGGVTLAGLAYFDREHSTGQQGIENGREFDSIRSLLVPGCYLRRMETMKAFICGALVR